MLDIAKIIELSWNDHHQTDITIEKVIHSKLILLLSPRNTGELLKVVVAMNLINSALKRKEYQSREKDALIHYRILKPRISKLFINILANRSHFDMNFYINPDDKCAYIEIDNLQFSFHNIVMNDTLKQFLNSSENNISPWNGIRLQKIAGELYDYYIGENRLQTFI